MAEWPSSFAFRAAELNPDSLAGIASGTELTVDRLSPGTAPSSVLQTQSPEQWALDITEINNRVHADGGLHRGIAGVLLVLDGEDSSICGIPLHGGSVILLAPGASLEANIRPGAKWMGTVMPAHHWEQIQAQTTGMTPKPMYENATVSRIAPGRAAILGGLARMAAVAFSEFREGSSPANWPRDYFDDYVSAVWEANASSAPRYEAIDRTYWRRVRQAYSARDFIFANLNEPISMTRLCVAIGVSRRQLEYAFQDAFGVNPRQFIHLRRLNEIRRALLRSERSQTVTDVALEHGVSHFGRFATSYRALFGESPRQTLAAARTRR